MINVFYRIDKVIILDAVFATLSVEYQRNIRLLELTQTFVIVSQEEQIHYHVSSQTLINDQDI